MREKDGPSPDQVSVSADADAASLDLASAVSFEWFYRREFPSLVALARALSRTPQLADDLAQEAMLTAFRRWDEVSTFDSPATWVRRVCANLARSHVRRLGVEARGLLRLGSRRQDYTEPQPVTAEVWANVRRLPKRQAQSVALYYIYDLGLAEIASTLGCSEGSVKVHLSRARATLARHLDPGSEVAP